MERIAPHMCYMGALTRLSAEIACATLRCPKGVERPTRTTYDANIVYGYTPSCVVIMDTNTSTVITVIAYGTKVNDKPPARSRQHLNRRHSRIRKNTIIKKSLSILDSLSVED